MDRHDLQRLSKEELIDLVLRLQRPDKTSRRPRSSDTLSITPKNGMSLGGYGYDKLEQSKATVFRALKREGAGV